MDSIQFNVPVGATEDKVFKLQFIISFLSINDFRLKHTCMCLPDTSRPPRAGLSTRIHSIVLLRETFYKTAKVKKEKKKQELNEGNSCESHDGSN